MKLDDYQKLAGRTVGSSDFVNFALGLAGEAGEVADIVKKIRYHGHDATDNIPKILDELGDVLWYIAGMCTVLNIPLSHVADGNVAKLQRRYPDGFSSEASKNRSE